MAKALKLPDNHDIGIAKFTSNNGKPVVALAEGGPTFENCVMHGLRFNNGSMDIMRNIVEIKLDTGEVMTFAFAEDGHWYRLEEGALGGLTDEEKENLSRMAPREQEKASPKKAGVVAARKPQRRSAGRVLLNLVFFAVCSSASFVSGNYFRPIDFDDVLRRVSPQALKALSPTGEQMSD